MNKTLLIGWDAADWKVIAPLVDDGKMPHLQKLIERGVMGNLATVYPILSPMLWTSIATGKRAFKHGIHGFSEPNPDTGGVRPITNLSRKTKAVWNILNQHGLKSNVVGWWPSHPAEPINGVMVSNHYQTATGQLGQPWKMQPGTVHPDEMGKELAQFRVHPWELEGEMLQLFIPNAHELDQEKDKRLYSCAKILAEASSIHAAATYLMQKTEWDFMAVYHDAIDHWGHGFMKFHPPKQEWVKDEDFELYKEVIESGYRYHDLMLGTMLQMVDENTNVILMSDHGFHPDNLRPQYIPNEPAGPAAEHRPFGIFVMAGPDIKQDDLVFGASILDITPTILSLYGLPVGKDMDGRPLTTAWKTPPNIEYIESWDTVKGDDGMHSPEKKLSAQDAKEAMDQLVALGYIDEPDDDQEKAVAQTERELQYNLARAYADANRQYEAAQIFEKLWEAFPDEGRFGVHLFNTQLSLDEKDAAGDTLRKLIKTKQEYATKAQEDLKALKEEHKDTKPEDLKDNVRHKMRKLNQKANTNLLTFKFLEGQYLQAIGNFDQALKCYEVASKAETHLKPSLLSKIAECQYNNRRLDLAEETYGKILEIDSVNPQARFGLSRIHFNRKDYEPAANEALAAVGQRYHFPQAHYLAGSALAQLSRDEEAIQELNTAIAQNPVFPGAHRLLATIYQRKWDKPRAVEHRRLARLSLERIRAWRSGERPELSDVQRQFDAEHPQAAIPTGMQLPDALPATEECHVIVTGLPRSGTSMLMQMLAAGGIPILQDDHRPADESNQKGYYELEKVKSLGRKPADWLEGEEGKAVKVIAQLTQHLPLHRNYRIIQIHRPLDEVVDSQTKMLDRMGREKKAPPERLKKVFQAQLAGINAVMTRGINNGHIGVLHLAYHDVLSDPATQAQRIKEFLGELVDEAAMSGVVDPTLYRSKS